MAGWWDGGEEEEEEGGEALSGLVVGVGSMFGGKRGREGGVASCIY